MHRSFFFKIGLIALPFLCIILILFDIALKIGDANPPIQVIRQQRHNPELIYMPVWTRADQFYYKFTAVNQIQPEILLIGSSRVYHWRTDIMFRERDMGYNAGLPSAEPLEVLWFLEGLAERGTLPDVLILAIDDLFFNQQGTFVRSNRVSSVIPPIDYSFDYSLNGMRIIARDYIKQPERILNFYQNYAPSNALGYSARTENRGYRPDGSFQFPDLFDVSPQLLANHERLYNSNQGIFQRGDTLYQPSIDAINNILILAEENNITVIGLYTPYNSMHYNRMISSGDYSYIPELREAINLLFAEFDMPLLDYTFAETVGGSDDELYDYLHAGEVLGLRVYYDMLMQYPDILALYSDADYIAERLNTATNAFFLD